MNYYYVLTVYEIDYTNAFVCLTLDDLLYCIKYHDFLLDDSHIYIERKWLHQEEISVQCLEIFRRKDYE